MSWYNPGMKAKEMLKLVRAGKSIYILGAYKCIRIDQKSIDKFSKAGITLWKDDGDNFRMASGKSSVYVFRNSVVVK